MLAYILHSDLYHMAIYQAHRTRHTALRAAAWCAGSHPVARVRQHVCMHNLQRSHDPVESGPRAVDAQSLMHDA